MAGFLGIVLMLAGAVCLSNAETYGEFVKCQEKAHSDCAESSVYFRNFNMDQISNFFQDKDNNVCLQKPDFSKLLTCFYDAQDSCVDAGDRDIFARASTYNSVLDHYCERVMNDTKYFNHTCFMKAKAEVDMCVKDKVTDGMELSVNSTIADYKVYQCSKIQTATSCYEDHLKACPSTKDALMEIMMKVKPEACSGTTIFYNSILIFFSLYLFKFFM